MNGVEFIVDGEEIMVALTSPDGITTLRIITKEEWASIKALVKEEEDRHGI